MPPERRADTVTMGWTSVVVIEAIVVITLDGPWLTWLILALALIGFAHAA